MTDNFDGSTINSAVNTGIGPYKRSANTRRLLRRQDLMTIELQLVLVHHLA